jgi:filamentous hemagglutinin family protein
MNHTYRVLWSDATGQYVAVPENASGRGKRSLGKKARTAIALAAGALAATALAEPTGGQVTAGQGTINRSGAVTTIQQASPRLAINWQNFGVGAGETVNFQQPGAGSVVLNRVLGTDGSKILGNLNANGQVFILNPNGVLFGQGAQVNVGGLLASTLSMTDADFLAGRLRLQGSGGAVTNQGTLRAADGGYIALVGGQVGNTGTMAARLGSVTLAAGNRATLDFTGDGLLRVAVDQGAVNALASNGGLIQADGGAVLMAAESADALSASAVNNTGVVQARTLQSRGGRIVLLAGMKAGTTQVAGTLDASAPNGGDGGFIETSAARVKVADGARITTQAAAGRTGQWLIDPQDYTIAATGGDISGATLSANLGTANVLIQSITGAAGTAGDVNVNDVVSWSANQLTLNAQNNINVNANLNASGTGRLALEYGQATGPGTGTGYNFNNGAKINLPAGNNFSTKQGSSGITNVYTVITDLGTATSASGTDLQGISGNLNGRYALGADIDASSTSAWNTGSGFTPLGNTAAQFTGTLDGLGHAISGLSINRPTTDEIGLFGRVGSAGRINNLGLVGGSVSGRTKVGALAGWLGGRIHNSYTDNTPVTGSGSEAGGLVGLSQGFITNSHAGGTVSGELSVGGLVGWSQGDIINSYATGNVIASNQWAGGLVGDMLNSATISGSYASGNVTSTSWYVGGLVGRWNSNDQPAAAINNSYAMGAVTGTSHVGGLVGHKVGDEGTINNSYAIGAVSGTSNLGGLVGLWDVRPGAAINNSFWDPATTGRATSSGGGMAMATAPMQQQVNFSSATAANGNVNPNWDFATVWRLYDGNGYPLLKALMKATTVTVSDGSKTYDKLAWNGGNGISCSNVACGGLSGSVSYGGTAQGAINAGSYTLTASGLYSNQQGYDISYANGTLTVNPASLAVTGLSAANKVYDASTTATLNGTASVTALAGDVVNLGGTGTGTFADRHVGNGKAVTVTGYTLSGAAAGNYVLATSLSANITPAPLVLNGVTAVSRTYNAGTGAALNTGGAALTGVFAGDTVTADTAAMSGSFGDKNVGTGKAVTVTGAALGGAHAGNYTVSNPTGLVADITPVALTVNGVTAANRVYDATTAAPLNTGGASVAGVLAGETVTLNTGALSGSFADRHVGTGKAVTVTGAALGGADAGNYTVANPTGLSANVTPAALAVAAANVTIVEGTPDPALTFTASGFAAGDTAGAALSGALARDPGAAAGTYTIRQGTLASVAGNYNLTFTPGAFVINAVPVPAPPAPAPAPAPAPTPAPTPPQGGSLPVPPGIPGAPAVPGGTTGPGGSGAPAGGGTPATPDRSNTVRPDAGTLQAMTLQAMPLPYVSVEEERRRAARNEVPLEVRRGGVRMP